MQPRLEITTERAQIEIITHRPTVEIVRRKPQLRVTRSPAQMHIEKKAPVMKLDRTAQWQALHIGPVMQQAQAMYRQALSDGLDAVGSIAGEGTALMDIQNSGNTIAQLAQQRLDSNDGGDLNTSMLPPPEVQWDPGYFNVNWTAHQLQLDWDVSTWADIRVEPGYVEIRMAKYPSLVIKVHYDEKNHQEKPLLNKYV